MPRRSTIALILVLLISSTSAFAEDRSASPGNGSGPSPPRDDHGLPTTAVTSTSGTVASDSSDCGEALRRETAQHQQQATATHSLPAPLVLPPECGGSPSPGAASK